MFILGLTTMGDAAACLIHDGKVVAAAEEERFSRIKHHVGFPSEAIAYVLEEAGIKIAEVEHVGLYWKPWIIRKRLELLLRSAAQSPRAFAARSRRGASQVGGHYRKMFSTASELKKRFGPARFRFHYLEHHLTHAASCFFVSPFERAAILTIDGTGEEATTFFALGEGTRIKPLHRIKLPHSLGQFYSAVTNYLGFDMMQGDEWKVMGLAGWGEPRFYDYLTANVLIPNGGDSFRYNTKLLDHHLAKHYHFNSQFAKVVGPPRAAGEEIAQHHRDLAASAQKVVEDVTLAMLEWLHDRTQATELCMAGGVVFNSLMNGKILEASPFKRVFFQPAAGDAGCSLGACYEIWNEKLDAPRGFVMNHAYWGPGYSDETCARALRAHGLDYQMLDEDQLTTRVAELLAGGEIVAWFHGRMEFGPRALGRRSFLADPRDPEIRDKLNREVKLREWFRPLAPSMREEDSTLFFGKPHRDPFMITVLPVHNGIRDLAPAIVHIDGTARPQTVAREANPRYWTLIDKFRRLTGVPCILNTSFNIQEPIVCTPEDAITTFKKSGVKHLVLEGCFVTKRGVK